MDFLTTLIYFILGLSFLILIHELGHFMFAKLFNVYVFEFAIGMGPIIFSKKKGESRYSIRAFPIGGYVAMAGENVQDEIPTETYIDNDTGETVTKKIDIPANRTINGINNFKKFLVVSAGVIFNFILCFILLVIVYTIDGAPSARINTVRITGDSIASKAGLQYDDFVISISGTLYADESKSVIVSNFPVKSYGVYELETNGEYKIEDGKKVLKPQSEHIFYSDVINELAPTKSSGQLQCLTLTVKRTTQPIEVCRTVEEAVLTDNGYVVTQPNYGINMGTEKLDLVEAMRNSLWVEWSMASTIFMAIGGIFSNFEQVGGPIAIFQTVGTFARDGFFYFLYLLAFISVNLGVVNLMPIPGLDGGRLIIILGETITRRKFPPKVEAIINTIGLYLLFGLMIVITFKDILNLF